MSKVCASLVTKLLCFGLLLSQGAFAQESTNFESNPGESFSIPFGPNDTSDSSKSLSTKSQGNISQPVVISFSGPPNTLGLLSSKSNDSNSGKSSPFEFNWQPMSFADQNGGQSSTINLQGSGSQSLPPGGGSGLPTGSFCDQISSSLLSDLLKNLSSFLGQNVSMDEYCSGSIFSDPHFNGGSPFPMPTPPASATPPSMPSTSADAAINNRPFQTVVAVLHKDTCRVDTVSEYTAKIDVNLNLVDPALFTSGFTVDASLLPVDYHGSTAALLKPVTTGATAPKPIIMMAALGGSSAGPKQKISIHYWQGSKTGQSKKLKFAGFKKHRGQLYATALLTNVLNGGEGVFELSNGQDTYSVCFQLIKKKQKANGFP